LQREWAKLGEYYDQNRSHHVPEIANASGICADVRLSEIILQEHKNYEEVLQQDPAKISAFLDPRIMKAESRGNNEYALLAKTYCLEHYASDSSTRSSPHSSPAHRNGVFELFAQDPTESRSSTITFDSEFSNFAAIQQQSPDLELDGWWFSQRFVRSTKKRAWFPTLYKLWCDFGAVPATSVPSERANSVGKETYAGRPSLSDEVFKAEVCIKSWLPLLESSGIEIPRDALEAWKILKAEKEEQEMRAEEENRENEIHLPVEHYANSDNVIAYLYNQNI
jgi:hypothetical protein